MTGAWEPHHAEFGMLLDGLCHILKSGALNPFNLGQRGMQNYTTCGMLLDGELGFEIKHGRASTSLERLSPDVLFR